MLPGAKRLSPTCLEFIADTPFAISRTLNCFFEHGGFGTLVGSQDEYAAHGFFRVVFFLWNVQIFFRGWCIL